MRYLNLTLLMVLLVLFSQFDCIPESEDCHKNFTFYNNSNEAVYIAGSNYYPEDTMNITYLFNPMNTPRNHYIDSNSINDQALTSKSCWEGKMQSDDRDTFMIFVFNADTVENNKWEDVYSNYWVLKRYDLSLQDMKNNNWEIIYP